MVIIPFRAVRGRALIHGSKGFQRGPIKVNSISGPFPHEAKKVVDSVQGNYETVGELSFICSSRSVNNVWFSCGRRAETSCFVYKLPSCLLSLSTNTYSNTNIDPILCPESLRRMIGCDEEPVLQSTTQHL